VQAAGYDTLRAGARGAEPMSQFSNRVSPSRAFAELEELRRVHDRGRNRRKSGGN